MSTRIKSPWILHYNCGSCNGCDIEILACLGPKYDVERFGIINKGNPKQADILVVTGPVTKRTSLFKCSLSSACTGSCLSKLCEAAKVSKS
jgi:Ni,Fe-hydrogenase III small subunit